MIGMSITTRGLCCDSKGPRSAGEMSQPESNGAQQSEVQSPIPGKEYIPHCGSSVWKAAWQQRT